jgi:DNA-binding NarL/FixJ family response regulator
MAQRLGTDKQSGRSHGGTLTTREAQVLTMISTGSTNAEIAATLGVTVHAVKFHLNGVYRKLGVANRTAAAVAYAQTPNLGVAPPRSSGAKAQANSGTTVARSAS